MQMQRIGGVLDVQRRFALVRCGGRDYKCSERAVHVDAGIEFYELREGLRVLIAIHADAPDRCRIVRRADD